jgi:hypothetical protein
MNELNQSCKCRDKPSQPEFACNCGTSIVFLCNLCVLPHLRELKPHSFISIEQAIKILREGSEFNKSYAEHFRTYTLYKTQAQDYFNSIDSFIFQIEELRTSILSELACECDSKIHDLRAIQSDLKSKLERLSNSITSSDFTELEKYQSLEKGVLEGYQDVFEVNQHNIKTVIRSMITIGCKENLERNTSELSIKNMKKTITSQESEIANLNIRIKEYQSLEAISNIRLQELYEKVEYEEAKIKEYESKLLYYSKLENEYHSKIDKLRVYEEEKQELLDRLAVYKQELRLNDSYKNTLKSSFRSKAQNLRRNIKQYQSSEEENKALIDNLQEIIDTLKSDNQELNRRILQTDPKNASKLNIKNLSVVAKEDLSEPTIQLLFKTLSGRSFSLECKSSDSIASIKNQIELSQSILSDRMCFIYKNNRLEDERTILDYNISTKDTIYILPQQNSNFQIFIKSLSAYTFTIYVSPLDSIRRVKEYIEEQVQIPSDKYKLTFEGRELEDFKTVSECNIQRESILRLDYEIEKLRYNEI